MSPSCTYHHQKAPSGPPSGWASVQVILVAKQECPLLLALRVVRFVYVTPHSALIGITDADLLLTNLTISHHGKLRLPLHGEGDMCKC